MGEDKIRIFVVDDHRVVRQGIFALLSFHSDIEMVEDVFLCMQQNLAMQSLNSDIDQQGKMSGMSDCSFSLNSFICAGYRHGLFEKYQWGSRAMTFSEKLKSLDW